MSLRPLQSALVISLLALPALLATQTSSNEDERMVALTRADSADWYVPKNNLSIGFRVLSSGAKVNFSQLGVVPFDVTPAPASAGVAQRTYNNGAVYLDLPRTNELDANGNQTSPPGGRYITTTVVTSNVTDANGNVIGTTNTTVVTGNFLSYTPGRTRNWSYGTPQQASRRPGYIAMSSYSATSDGAMLDKKQGPSGGIELQFEHTMGRLSKHTEWRLLTGVALNDINNKIRGNISATLHTNTDFYSLNGLAAPATTPATPYTAPVNGADLLAPNGTVLVANGFETTVPLAAAPDPALSTSTAVAGGTTVHGNYQVKGEYLMVKLGPSVHAQLTERFGLSASLGVAGAYAGTRYSVVESFEIPDVGGLITSTEESIASKFLSGYYADFNLEWLANERTGLFGGVSAQRFGNYDQTVGGRTARIDLGSSVGIRGGISIKF
jgi:hypothetical protein